MLKKIASWFIPSSEKLAKDSAKKIQEKVNAATDGNEKVVAEYAALAADMSQIASSLSSIMADAKIDDMESETLAALLVPLFDKAREVIGV